LRIAAIPIRRNRTKIGMLAYISFIKKNPTRCNNVSKFCIIPYLYKSQHVSGDTPPIRHRMHDNLHQVNVQQASTYKKPEAASGVLGS
jgi:hypothetical protein